MSPVCCSSVLQEYVAGVSCSSVLQCVAAVCCSSNGSSNVSNTVNSGNTNSVRGALLVNIVQNWVWGGYDE